MLDEALRPLIEWLSALPLKSHIQETGWAMPAIQTVHILAVGIILTGALFIALRALGVAGAHWSLARWHGRLHGWTLLALWVLLGTGVLMVLAEPERSLLNGIFRAKMLLVILTLIVAHSLTERLRRSRADRPVTASTGSLALMIFLCWATVAAAGRWIAYAG